MKYQTTMRRCWKVALGMLVPQRCLVCGEGIVSNAVADAPVCAECAEGLHSIEGEVCQRCGSKLISESHLCMRCRSVEWHLDGNRSLFEYWGTPRYLLRAYKFQGVRTLGRLFGARLSDLWQRWYAPLPIVPAPANPRSVARRGWNQTHDLAAAIRRCSSAPVLHLLLRRRSVSQKTLGRVERSVNLRDALFVRRRVQIPERLVLLDDVFTTGATLNECARVLKERGAREVYGLTLVID